MNKEEETAENQEKPKKPVFEKAKFEKTLPYKCILCDNTNVLYFNEIDELKEHINAVHRTEPLNTNVHEGEAEKRFKCSLCESRFSKTNDLRRHISSVHEGKRLYQCDKCEKSFKESGHLKSHIRRIHEGLKPHQCTFCDKKFADKKNYTRHIISVHDVKMPHKCNFCDTTFTLYTNLRKHIKIVHEGKKSYECSVCHEDFNLKTNLETHTASEHQIPVFNQRVHKNSKLYLKPDPAKCLKVKSSPKKIQILKIDKPSTSFKENMLDTSQFQDGQACAICRLTFIDKQSLNQHITSKHTFLS